MSLTENTITVNQFQWFYREALPVTSRENIPVMLLHGLPSQSFSWCEIMPMLADYGYRAIAPDWLGCGFSAQPDKRDFSYTCDAYVGAIKDLIAAFALDELSLVVQGFLGSVGLQYALRHPDKINRLIILNTPLSRDVKLPWMIAQWGWPLIGDMLTQDPLLVDRSLEGGSGFVIDEDNLQVYRKPFLTSSAAGRALVNIVKNLKNPSSLEEINSGLREWKKPVMIIWGTQDPWLSVSEAENLATKNPHIELVKLEKAKHYPQEHWSKEIAPVIVNFLGR